MLKPMLFSVELGCARWFIIILFPQPLFLKKKYFDALKLHDSCKKINIKREWLYEPSDTINVLSKNHGKCDKNSIISKMNVGQLPFSSGKIPRLNETEIVRWRNREMFVEYEYEWICQMVLVFVWLFCCKNG